VPPIVQRDGKTQVVTARPSPALTPYDPIKDHVGQKKSAAYRGTLTSTVLQGAATGSPQAKVVTAAALPSGRDNATVPSLPRRNYLRERSRLVLPS
jgi:hypothetical protein